MSSTTISVRLADELSEAVDQFAAGRNLKASEAVRELIQLGLRAQNNVDSDRDFPVSAQLNVLFEDLKQSLLWSHQQAALVCLQTSLEAAEATYALVKLQAAAKGATPPTRDQITEMASRRVGEWISLVADAEDREVDAGA